MGDHTSETLQQLQKRLETYACKRLLGDRDLKLDENSIPLILNHIDCFVSQSRGNKSVEDVYFCPYEFHGQDDDVWDKVGQAIGNLKALKRIHIFTHNTCHDNDNEDEDSPNWGELARILSHIRQKVEVNFDDSDLWAVGELQALARAIRGHPTITGFGSCYHFPYDYMDAALATLPALESILLSTDGRHARAEDESTVDHHHESLTELLRVPSLRSVCFESVCFTPALCQATANALMDGTAVTELEFDCCLFSEEECVTILANAFTRNTSVSHIKVVKPLDDALCDALAMALPSNSTLQELSFLQNVIYDPSLSPVFLALERNTGLKTLKVDVCIPMDESLSTAIKNGLGMNETLESLEFHNVDLIDDNADLWCRALSFLRTNKALKSLMVDLQDDVTQSCLSTFRVDIAAMLQENASVVSLSVRSNFALNADEFFVLVTALQQNTTLKILKLSYYEMLDLTDDEDKRMAALLKKNYALESLPDIGREYRPGDLDAILRLNRAGRRYLVQDGSSVSKGVEVLSRVNNNINCAFLHLLENPRLCDRSAVEMVTAGESIGRSTNPSASSGGGKREHACVHKSRDRESCWRRTYR
jgi:hypothetical protein